jgi:hypothetical protein
MIKLKLDSYRAVSNFLKNEKKYFFSLITSLIRDGWENNIENVNIIEFHVKDSMLKVDVNVEDWNNVLHLALDYYESIEDYENCVEVSDLILDIYGKVNHKL